MKRTAKHYLSQALLVLTGAVFGFLLSLLVAAFRFDGFPSGEDFPQLVLLVLLNLLGIVGLATWFAYRKHAGLLALRKAHRQLVEIQKRQQALMDSIPDLAWVKDTQSRFIAVNAKFKPVFGIEPDELIGKTDFDLSPHRDAEHYQEDDREVMRSGKPLRTEERIAKENNTWGWAETVKVPVYDADNNIVGTAGVARDITERKQAEQRIEFLANHDALTGLPNRRLLEDRLKQALARAALNKEKLAVLFLDLDYFKSINDSASHSIGDTLLQTVAERLTACVRSIDTVARLAGDEFVVLLPAIQGLHEAETTATRIQETVARPYAFDDSEYHISTSIGISLYPDHGDQDSILLRNADIAMYRAKDRGRNCHQVFTPREDEQTLRRFSLGHRLRQAHKQEEFTLYYQPQIDINTRKICGVEALLRWKNPEQGLMYPRDFLNSAEQSGLIITLGNWVLQTAAAQNKAWQDAGCPAVPVSINIADAQFRRQDLHQIIENVLNDTGLAAEYLELELTESMVQDGETTLAYLKLLKELGLSIAIDDFGTGYSNFGRLLRFPIDKLIIDHSFIRGISNSQDSASITGAIINLATTLGIEIVAEGVETAEELAFIKRHGCHIVQGYFYCKPVTAEVMRSMLLNGNVVEPHLPPSPRQSAL
jgi:diguanylate cyclase (GGDEF)-like protein/PAS domain S-box-containing protein